MARILSYRKIRVSPILFGWKKVHPVLRTKIDGSVFVCCFMNMMVRGDYMLMARKTKNWAYEMECWYLDGGSHHELVANLLSQMGPDRRFGPI